MSDVEPSPPKKDAEKPAEAAAPQSSGTRASGPPARGLRIARALLAPVLVLGAVGVHFALNVPEHKVEMKKKKKPAGKKRSARAKKVERSVDQMDADWARWKVEPYDGEPIKGKWGRRMQSIVNKAVVVARKEAFEGAPEDPRVVVSETQCRTVRCRFVLRSPFEHEPGLVVEALRRQTYDGKPLWRMVETEPADPPTPHSPKTDHYLQVTVGVSVDGIESRDIGFKAAKDAPAEVRAKALPKPKPTE